MVLGAILGTILEQNRIQKSIQKMIRFLMDFGRVLAPFGEPKGTKIARNGSPGPPGPSPRLALYGELEH